MSGHSKWNNIKQKKGKQDAIKGKIFTKIGREISVAVKEGGPNPDTNAKLRYVIAKAKANNMPNNNIENAIKKASGEGNQNIFYEMVYEGYGKGGVAVIVNALTDNKNRTASDIRHVFGKFGGNLGEPGSVAYNFSKKGVIVIEKEQYKEKEEEIMMEVLDAGAEDFKEYDEVYEILTSPNDFDAVNTKVEKLGIQAIEAGIQSVANLKVSVDDATSENIQKLIEALEDLDDVQEVFTNME